MINRPSSRLRSFCIGFAAAFGPATLCVAQFDYNNPGYQWGRQNCHGPTMTSWWERLWGPENVGECKTCCDIGRYNKHFDPEDHDECHHFCDQAYWL